MTDQMATDEHMVRSVVLDYFEGWFEGDAARMERALHPALAKRALEADRLSLDETTADWMIAATARGVDRERHPDDLALDVVVNDIHGDIAAVVVHSAVYREYVHLARTTQGWKIVNTLYALS